MRVFLTDTAVGDLDTFSLLAALPVCTGYTLAATSAGLTGATSNAFNITVGPAAKLTFTTQPSNAVAGVSISRAVQGTDQNAGGNTVAGSTASNTNAIGTNPGGGTLGG